MQTLCEHLWDYGCVTGNICQEPLVQADRSDRSTDSSSQDAKRQATAAAERARQAAQHAAARASKASSDAQQQVSNAARSTSEFLSAVAQELLKSGKGKQGGAADGAQAQASGAIWLSELMCIRFSAHDVFWFSIGDALSCGYRKRRRLQLLLEC
jgi:hypothetical protein